MSVPSDYNNAKVRIARYVVLEKNSGEYTSPVLKPKEDVKPKAEKPAKVKKDKTKAAEKPVSFPATKVDAFKDQIRGLQAQGINPVTYGSKRITSARRPEWKIALRELGIIN